MATNAGGGSYRSANEQALVGFFTNVLPKGQTAVSNAADGIGKIGAAMTAASTNLSGSNSNLQGGWSGPAATAFHTSATEIAKFTNTMGTDLGSSGGGGVAGKLTTVSTAMTTAQHEFATTTNNWTSFLKTASQQIAQAVSNALATQTAVSQAVASANGFQAIYGIAVNVPMTAAGPSPAMATATVTITPFGSRYGHNYGTRMTLTLSASYLSTLALAGDIHLAEVDEYLDDLRDSLAKLDSAYSSAATMPTNATGAVYTMGPDTGTNSPNLGGGGLNGGAGTPNMTTPKTTTPSTSTPQTSAASGAGKTGTGTGTTGAGTGTIGAGTGTSGLGTGTGTSLASTPTTTTSLGTGTGTGTSTIPTITSTTPTTSTGTTTGGVVPYVGTALPTTSDSGLGTSKYGLGDSSLGGTGTGTGVASESTPFNAATENTGTGTLGSNGLTDGTGAGTAAESGLASEAAGTTTTGRQMPYMPMMPMSPGMGGSDGDRKRSAWLDEDDVWATDSDPVPAVIGGDI